MTSLLSVQILDVLVPQTGNQLVEIHEDARHCDTRAGYRKRPTSLKTEFVDPASSAEGGTVGGKCRPSCLIPLCSSSLASRTWTFQFLALVVIMEVFKVFTQDKVRCRRIVEQIVDIPLGGSPQDFLS